MSYVAHQSFSSVNLCTHFFTETFLVVQSTTYRPPPARRVVSSVVYVALELLVVLLVQFLSFFVSYVARKNFSSNSELLNEIFLVLRVARPPRPRDELFVWSGKS